MQDFESEDQQIEALKKWWQENGKSLIAGVVVGVAGIFGWREYVDHNLGQSQVASDLYNIVSMQTLQGNFTDINKYEQLQNEFSATPYAALAALSVARFYFDEGKADEAITQLQWAKGHTAVDEVKHLANVRLVAVYLAQKQFDAAQSLLSEPHPEAFAMRYEELKGDLYLAQGDKDKARDAYDKALASEGIANPLLQLKRKNLGS